MFNSTQTLRIPSINDSASKSISKILELTKKYPIQDKNNYTRELFYAFYGIFIE